MFEFNGDWETEINIEVLKDFLSVENYKSDNIQQKDNSIVKLFIIDDLSNNPDPLPEQSAAIDYLTGNQHVIIKTILHKIKVEYEGLLDIFEEKMSSKVSIDEDIKHSIRFEKILVLLDSKEGTAYIGLDIGFKGEWNEERGLSILMHKNKIIYFGEAASESYYTMVATEDGAIDIKKNESVLLKPQIYTPHLKYGKLKPWQQYENEMFEHRLIEKGNTKDFISFVENGQIDINVKKGLSMTFLERASQFNNTDLVKFILTQKPKNTEGVIQSATHNFNKEILEAMINYGAKINELNHYGDTPLLSLIQNIQEQNLDNYEDMIDFLIKKGANPFIANIRNGNNALDYLKDFSEKVQIRIKKTLSGVK
jgi:hypothetical protein